MGPRAVDLGLAIEIRDWQILISHPIGSVYYDVYPFAKYYPLIGFSAGGPLVEIAETRSARSTALFNEVVPASPGSSGRPAGLRRRGIAGNCPGSDPEE